MKLAHFARLAAVEAYQKTFGKLPISLRFIVEGEDGLGSPSLFRFTSEHPDLLTAQGCIWDEGYRDTKERPVISLGFKGITFIELRLEREVDRVDDLFSRTGTPQDVSKPRIIDLQSVTDNASPLWIGSSVVYD